MVNGGLPAWAKEVLKYVGAGGGLGAAVLVVWVAIAQPMREDFRTYQLAQIEAEKARKSEAAVLAGRVDALKDEFSKFTATFTEWTRQVFVSRDLYEQRRTETDRLNGAQDEAIKDLRRQIEELRKK